ncbi:DctP family TRAP transporter solute-binding subunit [Azospirillum sp. Vi22]|uniref:DctP family TRAP transporter solute-binding subunit n=1 Tax=Azospirillum baldaniorum TaxID=1064539 RepID=UPI00157AF593|nr:DctP family TRAP transporter solute-binding subunit [Azospirillum baldaniorum]NUB09117.1 DctP family TRAP transporter solute-binding subunit [Azospirillum baldaniorum]
MLTRTRPLLAAALTLFGALAVLSAPAEAAEYKSEYKLSVVGSRPIPIAEGAYRWADLVTEKTKGRITVKVYPGSSLVGGDNTREFTGLRQGSIDLLVNSTINLSPTVKEANLFSLPFLFPDSKAFDAVAQGEPGKSLFGILETKQVVPLAVSENGFRALSNSKKPVRTPDDLKGLKVRVVGSPIFNDIFTALGANPTQMTFADLQPALSTGAVDGQENPVSLFLAAKLYGLNQKHLTLWNYIADAGLFIANKEVWESWTPEDRALVREAAVQAAAEFTALSRQGLTAEDRSALTALAAHGVQVVTTEQTDVEAFRKATRPVYEKWTQTVGADLVRKAEEAVAKSR